MMATDSETNSKSSTTVVSLNRFSFKLFNQIVQLGGKSKNVFFSPFSVSSLIAMITAGARGSTKQQLVATLSLNQEGSESTKQISDSNCVGAAFKVNNSQGCLVNIYLMTDDIILRTVVNVIGSFRLPCLISLTVSVTVCLLL